MEYKETDEMYQDEIWKDVVGYEGLYQVSNFGRVMSLPKSFHKDSYKVIRHKIILLSQSNMIGYRGVNLYLNGRYKTIRVHRLVALAFLPNKKNKRCINHKNGIKHDNQVENLEWATHSENQFHAYRTKLKIGHVFKREEHPNFNKGIPVKLIDTFTNGEQYFVNLRSVAEYLNSTYPTVKTAYRYNHLHKRRYKIERDVSNL